MVQSFIQGLHNTGNALSQNVDNAILPVGNSYPARIAEDTLSTVQNKYLSKPTPTGQITTPPPYRDEALQKFTPEMQNYLRQVQYIKSFKQLPKKDPYKDFPALAMTYTAAPGAIGGQQPQTAFNSSFLDSFPQTPHLAQQTIANELMQAVPKPIGFNAKNFLGDVEQLQKTDPQAYNFVRSYADYFRQKGIPESDVAQETYAFIGSHYGPAVFSTPLGKYYKNVLKE